MKRHLREEEKRQELVEEARGVIGTMKRSDARALEDSVRKLREGPWR